MIARALCTDPCEGSSDRSSGRLVDFLYIQSWELAVGSPLCDIQWQMHVQDQKRAMADPLDVQWLTIKGLKVKMTVWNEAPCSLDEMDQQLVGVADKNSGMSMKCSTWDTFKDYYSNNLLGFSSSLFLCYPETKRKLTTSMGDHSRVSWVASHNLICPDERMSQNIIKNMSAPSIWKPHYWISSYKILICTVAVTVQSCLVYFRRHRFLQKLSGNPCRSFWAISHSSLFKHPLPWLWWFSI